MSLSGEWYRALLESHNWKASELVLSLSPDKRSSEQIAVPVEVDR